MGAQTDLPGGGTGFHVKGSAYRGLQGYVAQSMPGGMEALMVRLPEAARTFFGQTFSQSAWYDVIPMEELTRTCASIARLPHELLCHRYADATLAADDGGVYRAILRFATAELLVRALPFTTTRYFDFVRSSVDRVEDKNFRVTVTGVPRPIIFTYIHVTSIFIQRALEGAGAQNVVMRASPPRPLATQFGQPTVEFDRHLSWA